jgi:hypothetical protein
VLSCSEMFEVGGSYNNVGELRERDGGDRAGTEGLTVA